MRLAFFENNDITPDTWKDIDFNTLSTLILKHNIQQDLQEQTQPIVQRASSSSGGTSVNAFDNTSNSIITNSRSDNSASNNSVPLLTSQSTTSLFHRQQQQQQQQHRQQQHQRQHHSIAQQHLTPTSSPPPPTTPSRPSKHRQHSQIQPRSQPPLRPRPRPTVQQPATISKQPVSASNSETKANNVTINQFGQFLCDEPDCGKTFPSLRKLRHHKVVHSDEFPFVCQSQGCGKRFKRKFGIDLHSTTHFDLDPEMYEKTSNNSSLTLFGRRMQYSMCKPCNQKFKTVHDYQDHMLRHGREPFKCLVEGCGQTFSIWKSFQKHRASHYFNYYCKMDPQCDHSTSNLQLLKLHIYCCHFRRTLPENSHLRRDDGECGDGDGDGDGDVDADGDGDVEAEGEGEGEEDMDEEELTPLNQTEEDDIDRSLNDTEDLPKSDVGTPRRDPRLRRNPPRSSTFVQQDYASINNGSSLLKMTSPPTPVKRARSSAASSSGSQPNTPEKKSTARSPIKIQPKRACVSVTSSASQYSTPEKKPKLPLKILPKRSAQRLPMSLIAADEGSTEDDDCSDISSTRNGRGNAESDPEQWDTKFKCHLCDYKFSVRFQLTKHLSTHLELSQDMYSATADTKVIQLSERRRREFYCEKCNLKFEEMPDLDVHMRKHASTPYVCLFCPIPSTFKLAKQYLSHLYEHRFKYKCTMDPDCDFTINRKDALKLHIFRMHLNQQLPAYIEDYANMAGCNEWTE